MTTDWLTKVHGLLAQAESTKFPAEAEAFMAKAQHLMSLHAIDEAMLRSRNKTRAEVIVDTIDIVNPYLNQKHMLLDQICRANTVKCVMTDKRKGSQGATITMVGFKTDVENAKTMFATLSLYAVNDMLKQHVPVYESARGFRVSYILGFASRIGKRLEEMAASAKQEYADANSGASGMELVLVEKSKDVAVKYADHFAGKRMVSRVSSAGSSSGYKAGKSAADRANINRGVSAGARRALGA